MSDSKCSFYLEMIDEIYTANPNLSIWETDFLANIQHWLNKGKRLSDRQAAKVEDIFKRIGTA